MILFLAHTPMQLMNAVILAKTEFISDSCDLYYTDSLSIQVSRLEKEGVFHSQKLIRVKAYQAKNSNLVSKMVTKIRNIVDLKQIRNSLPTDPMQYSRVLISGITLRNIEFYYAIKSLNPDVRLSVYEEGTSEYCNLSQKKLFEILVSKICFHRYYLQDCDSIYVHMPQLVSLAWKHISIEEIQEVRYGSALFNILNRVMGYKTETLKDCAGKIIFLEQAFYDESSERAQKAMLEQICKAVGYENVRIKLHPRSMAEKYGKEYSYLEVNCPFEIVAMNEPVDEITFISINSSAIFNFKLMLKQEPQIVLLNKIAGNDSGITPEIDHLIVKLQGICADRSPLIPESTLELTEILKHLTQK